MKSQREIRHKMNAYLALWVGSYLLILLIPLVLGISLYNSSVNLLIQEIEKVHLQAFSILQRNVDSALSDMEFIGNLMALDQKAAAVAAAGQEEDTQAIMYAAQLQASLSNTLRDNKVIGSIALHFFHGDYAITATSSARGSLVEPLLKRELGISPEEYRAMAENIRLSRFFLGKGGSLYLIRTISASASALYRKDGLVIVRLNPAYLNQQLEATAQTTGGTVWVSTGEGSISSTGKDPMPEELFEGVEESAVARGYLLTSIPSQKAGILYASATPRDTVLKNVSNIRKLIYVYLGLCLGVGVFLSYFLARRYYDPVRKMSSLLALHEEAAREGMNEMKHVQASLMRLLDKSTRQDSTISRQEKELQGLTLRKLLKGEMDSLPEGAPAFPHPYFLVAAFYLPESTNLFAVEAPGSDAGKSSRGMLKEIIGSIAGQKFICQCASLGGTVYAVINLSREQQAGAAALAAALCGRVRDTFTELFGVAPNIGISAQQEGLVGIAEAARQAEEVISYANMLGQERALIHYEDLTPSMEADFVNHELSALERKVCQSIREGKIENARYMLKDVFESYGSASIRSGRMVRLRVFGLISSLLEAFSQSSIEVDVVDDLFHTAQIFQFKSLQEVGAALQSVFKDLSNLHEETRKVPIADALLEIKEYIHGNYQNPDLGVASIAAAFSLNASYLSRSFKKQEQMNLLDYIHKVRIERAKELLQKGYAVKDIATMTGYYNSLSMIRVFKRYEGTTPGKYRESDKA